MLNRCILSCLLAFLLCVPPVPGQGPAPFGYRITTIAGTGEDQADDDDGTYGDGLEALSAYFWSPRGLGLDSAGNLYVADELHHKVRKIATDGIVSTYVGTGIGGAAGDEGAANEAYVKNPTALAVDRAGNLYIADAGNHKVRKVTADGYIDTIIGNGEQGYTTDSDPNDAQDDWIPADEAKFNTPVGIALDNAGNIFIADTLNHRIRRVDSAGYVWHVAGNGTAAWAGDGGLASEAQLNYPNDVAVDNAGNVYIADTLNGLIRKVDTQGIITTIAGVGINAYFGDGGPAVNAGLDYPKSIKLDAEGNLYIADTLANRIRVITASDGIIRTIAGSGLFGDSGEGGPALEAHLMFPSALLLDGAGNIYVSDSQNNKIKLLTPVASAASSPAAPVIKNDGVVSASAFGGFRSAAPGSWIEIYGENLASSARVWSSSDFSGLRAPTALGGTRVTVGGVAAFLSYVSPTQINALIPANVPRGAQPIKVITSKGVSAPHVITINEAQPGIYAPPTFQVGAVRYAGALVNGEWAFAAPAGAIPGTVTRKARAGDQLVLFGVGFGPVTPAVNTGEIAQSLNSLALPVQFYLGGKAAAATYQGLAPGSIGVYQFNVVVPQGVSGDAVPLTFTLDGRSGTQTLSTAVEQ